jgi:hypothetical protein
VNRYLTELVILDAGYSAAALTAALRGCPTHLLIRLPADSVFYADPSPGPARKAAPARGWPSLVTTWPWG